MHQFHLSAAQKGQTTATAVNSSYSMNNQPFWQQFNTLSNTISSVLLLFCMAQTLLHCSTTTIKPSANGTFAAVQDSPSHFAFYTRGFRILKMPEEHQHAQDGIKKGMKVENSNLVQGICPNQNPGFPSNRNSPCRQKPVPSCHTQDAGSYFFWYSEQPNSKYIEYISDGLIYSETGRKPQLSFHEHRHILQQYTLLAVRSRHSQV